MRERQPTLRELFDIGRDNAARIFEVSGEVLPIWHAVPEHGEHMLISTPWTNDDEKDAAMEFLRYKFKEDKILRFVCVLEAWVVKVSDPKIVFEEMARPSQHPDRREVIRIQAEDRDGSVLSGQYYILRPEHGPATLSKFHEDPSNTSFAGRMTGLLAETRH